MILWSVLSMADWTEHLREACPYISLPISCYPWQLLDAAARLCTLRLCYLGMALKQHYVFASPIWNAHSPLSLKLQKEWGDTCRKPLQWPPKAWDTFLCQDSHLQNMLWTGSFGGKAVKMIPSRSPRGPLGYIYLFVAYPLSFGSQVMKMRLVSTLKRVGGLCIFHAVWSCTAH